MKEMTMFAVLKTGGKQYKVQSGDMLRVEKLAADAGETIQFNEILMLGGDAPVIGAPFVADAAVDTWEVNYYNLYKKSKNDCYFRKTRKRKFMGTFLLMDH